MSERPPTPLRTPVAIYAVDTSGCGACQESIVALQATRYAGALRQAGVTFADTPRQAAILLLTGALSAGTRESVARVIEATPQPRALIAVGDCAIDGCVFGAGAGLSESLAEALNVHVEIAGCPPTPEAILGAIRAAKNLLRGDREGAEVDADEAEGAAVEEGSAEV